MASKQCANGFRLLVNKGDVGAHGERVYSDSWPGLSLLAAVRPLEAITQATSRCKLALRARPHPPCLPQVCKWVEAVGNHMEKRRARNDALTRLVARVI